MQVRLSDEATPVIQHAATAQKRSLAYVVNELLKESPTYQKLCQAMTAQPKPAKRS